jgi:cobalt/nickel transport protein
MSRTDVVMLAVVVALVVAPLALHAATGGGDSDPFTGADQQAGSLIEAIAPAYEPWFDSPFSPPSTEVESMLFAVQAAIGGGVIGYYVGSRRRAKGRRDEGARHGD